MKRMLSITALLWLVVSVVYAQLPPPRDSNDPIGQRIGWTPDQIAASVKAEGAFEFYSYSKYDEDDLLGFKTADGTLLMYTIKDGKATKAMMIAPTADGIGEGWKSVYLKPIPGHVWLLNEYWYHTPYANVFCVVRPEAGEMHFIYEPRK